MRCPMHHPLPVIGVVRCAGKRGEHRFLRLFDLQQQRRTIVRNEQANRAEGADAADPDGLECDVTPMVALQQHPPVLLQALGIRRGRLVRMQFMVTQMAHQRWLVLDFPIAVFSFDEAEMLSRTPQNGLAALLDVVADFVGFDVGYRAGEIDARAPRGERGQQRQLLQVTAIALSGNPSEIDGTPGQGPWQPDRRRRGS